MNAQMRGFVLLGLLGIFAFVAVLDFIPGIAFQYVFYGDASFAYISTWFHVFFWWLIILWFLVKWIVIMIAIFFLILLVGWLMEMLSGIPVIDKGLAFITKMMDRAAGYRN